MNKRIGIPLDPAFARETLKRTEAARLLDEIRVWLAQGMSAADMEQRLQDQYRIPRLEGCDGEAHGNPHIDHCSVCAPRWGLTGKAIKIT